MLRTSNVKRILSIFLVISLICSNFSPMILGFVSLALEENEAEDTTVTPLEIETVEFSKNNMLEEETEYDEKVKLNLDYEEPFTEVVISDVSTKITDGVIEEEELVEEDETEEQQEELNIFYKATKINIDELSEIIGETGKLEIEYEVLEEEDEEHSQIIAVPEHEEEELPEDEEEEDELLEEEDLNESEELPEESEEELEEENKEELPVGVVVAEDGMVTITAETEADENGDITIIYPEKTNLISIKISTETNIIENLTIINTKTVEKVTDLEKVAELETVKNIVVKQEIKEKKEIIEVELLNEIVTTKMPINYSKTFAELGADKNQISTSIENKLALTITLNTEKAIYDLYKNPYFIIELPSEFENVTIDRAVIINNEAFEPEALEQITLENGNNAITLKLNGEQIEHTKSAEANIQIVLELTIKTEELIPTLDREITLHYTNENANTYNGIELEEEGTSIAPVQLVSNSEILVETRATVGDTTTIALKDNTKVINIAPNTYNKVKVEGTVINNTGASIKNAKILVSATNISEIAGVETVYYTENEEATAELNNAENLWTSEYTSNVNKALIVIPEYEQGQTIKFEYIMNLPEHPQIEMAHVATFEVYDNNDQNIKTSKITVNQEEEKQNEYITSELEAKLEIEKTELEVGDLVKLYLNINNNLDRDINNATIELTLPEELELLELNMPEEYGFDARKEYIITNVNLEENKEVRIEIGLQANQVYDSIKTIKATIKNDEDIIEMKENVKFNSVSEIETNITSDKQGIILNKNDMITYTITLKNRGNAHAVVDIDLIKTDNISILQMSRENLNTGEVQSMTSGDLMGKMTNISINPNETVRILVDAIVNEVESNTVETVYAEITGKMINNTKTNTLSNKIDKKEEKTVQRKEDKQKENSITGLAWIDRNSNGRKDENEILLKGVQVRLIDTDTSKIVATQKTNNNGEYSFKALPKGNYVVEFDYNTDKLTITDYKKDSVESEFDSDIINTTQSNTTTSKTEVIPLEAGKDENVNAGFVVNKKFDISISKEISKVTVDNKNDIETQQFQSTKSAKMNLDSNYLKDSLLLVEYDIKVTNCGDIEGYINLISDILPEGMVFNSELNTNWYEDNNGMIYSVALSDIKLQPGETQSIKLVLTKEIKNEQNIYLVNTAIIEKTFNEYLIEDNNNENDISKSELTITTNERRK